MTLLEPARSVENLIYIGFPGDPSTAIRVTRRRRLDRKKQQCERKVFQCFVFGPNNAGKSALLNCFLGRFVMLTRTTTCWIFKIHRREYNSMFISKETFNFPLFQLISPSGL